MVFKQTAKQKVIQKLCMHLENAALNLAKPGVCGIMWGETTLPDTIKKACKKQC